jgi:hypothetical protein
MLQTFMSQEKRRNLPPLHVDVKRIVARSYQGMPKRSLFALNAQLLAAVKPSSTTTNAVCSSGHGHRTNAQK